VFRVYPDDRHRLEVGGRATGAMVWTTGKFRAENPTAYAAFFDALKESIDIISTDPDHAAQVYTEMENSKLDPVLIRALVADPEDIWCPSIRSISSISCNGPAGSGARSTDGKTYTFPRSTTNQEANECNRRAPCIRQSGCLA
jgi:hypothetical protein